MARLKKKISPQHAFALGAVAMRRLAMAKCGNLTESLEEGIMTDAGLTAADKKSMNSQIDAIEEVRKDIDSETWERAAYYGSYILGESEQEWIKTLFPKYRDRK